MSRDDRGPWQRRCGPSSFADLVGKSLAPPEAMEVYFASIYSWSESTAKPNFDGEAHGHVTKWGCDLANRRPLRLCRVMILRNISQGML
jgi:hypothetical protein